MKLGIVADEIDRDIRKAVAIGTALGLKRYEIRNLPGGRVPMCDPRELIEVEEAMRDAGAEVTAISPGLFKFADDARAFRTQMEEIYPRAAELAHRWNLPALIVFGMHKPGATEANAPTGGEAPAEVVECLAAAGERASSDGLFLMIEPEPICWAEDARSTADLIGRTASPHLRINYDPANDAWLRNADPIADFAAAAPYIANVHIKDIRPLDRGPAHPEWVPAGEGLVHWSKHFELLRKSGYQGPFSLEPHMDGKSETIQRCKSAVEREWGEE